MPNEDEKFRAFRERGEIWKRTPETSEWLREIADTTAAGGRWSRVHVVDRPLSDYTRFELLSYPDNVAAGEDIRIADRDAHPELAGLTEDFWLFDAEEPGAYALLMHYDEEGHFLGCWRAGDPETLDRCRRRRDLAWSCSVPLQDYLAEAGLDAARSG